MPRYIDADKLLDILDVMIVGHKSASDVYDVVDGMPTVDAEPVRHGRWLKNGSRYCECSVCHHEGNTSGADNYCWFCGAKMSDE